jgi:hypothetical protein
MSNAYRYSFKDTSFEAIYLDRNIINYNCVSVSDSSGMPLFYWRRNLISPFELLLFDIVDFNGDTILNGTGIKYHGIGSGFSTQTLPFYSNDNMSFGLFNIICRPTLYTTYPPLQNHPTGLYYHEVKIDSMNKPFVFKKNHLISTEDLDGFLASVMKSDKVGWWIVSYSDSLNSLVIFNFVQGKVVAKSYFKTINTLSSYSSFNRGKLFFNNKGDKLILCSQRGSLSIFDFDRANGIISDERIIFTPKDTIIDDFTIWSNQKVDSLDFVFGSGCFSPNDSIFYLSTRNNLYQFIYSEVDSNIRNSQINLVTLPNEDSLRCIVGCCLTPNNKIYVHVPFTAGYTPPPYPNVYNRFISLVMNPNIEGINCNFVYKSDTLELDTATSYGLGLDLPNYPNYRIRVKTSIDSILVASDTLCIGVASKLSSSAPPWSKVQWQGASFSGLGKDYIWQNPDTSQWVTLRLTDTTASGPNNVTILRKYVLVVPDTGQDCKKYTSIKVPFESSFRVYPNPATTTITLKANTGKLDGQLSFYNLSGQVVYQTNISNDSTHEWNVSGLPSGIYYLRLADGTNEPFVQKVVVSR